MQFTIGEQTHDKLRRLQTLLRREIPDGDPGAIFDRAITVLLEKVEKKKLGAAAKPRPPASIRPGTDKRRPDLPSPYVPPAVKRAAWQTDGGQCGYVAPSGRRCTERAFLEFHHVQPRAKQGPATDANIVCAAGATTNMKPSWPSGQAGAGRVPGHRHIIELGV